MVSCGQVFAFDALIVLILYLLIVIVITIGEISTVPNVYYFKNNYNKGFFTIYLYYGKHTFRSEIKN